MNFLFKVILFPLIIYLATFSNFVALPPLILLVLSTFLIIIGIIAEPIVLPVFGNLISTLMGTFFIIFSLWITPVLTGRGYFKLEAAIVVGVILGIIEFTLHHVFILKDK